MSRLWPDRIVVGLEPGRLTAIRSRWGWKPQIVARHDQRLEDDQKSWKPIVAALTHLLSLPEWHKGRVEVVLSNHFVHYAVVPTTATLNREAQHNLAQLVFKQKFGDLSQGWDIRISANDKGNRHMASAIPKDFLDALRVALGKRLHSLRPALMCAINQSLKVLGSEAGHLALLEPGRITLASLDEGQWQVILSRAVMSGDFDDLPRLISEECLIGPNTTSCRVWLCDLGSQETHSCGSSWKTTYLTPQWPLALNQKPTLACWGMM